MFKLRILWDLNKLMDSFQWSIMIGYGNTGSYVYPKFAKKRHVISGHFIFPLLLKVYYFFSLRNNINILWFIYIIYSYSFVGSVMKTCDKEEWN